MYPNYRNIRKDLGFAAVKDEKSTAKLISASKKVKNKSVKVISISSLVISLNSNNVKIKSLKSEKNTAPIVIVRGGGNPQNSPENNNNKNREKQNSISGLDWLESLLKKDKEMESNLKKSSEEEKKINEQRRKEGKLDIIVIVKEGIKFSLLNDTDSETLKLHILDPDTKFINHTLLNVNHETTGIQYKINSYILVNDRTGEEITRNLISHPDKKIPEINTKQHKKIETFYLFNDKTGYKIYLKCSKQ